MKHLIAVLLLALSGCSSIEIIRDKPPPDDDRVQITEPDWHPARRGK